MRLQLLLSPNTEPVPFNHLHQLTGALHKWLGQNDLHDQISLYSFGWLRGGVSRRGSLGFPKGATWNISFYNEEMARRLLRGILDQPTIAYGMNVAEVREIAPPVFRRQHYFQTDGSSVVARQPRSDGSREYLLWNNPDADQVLTGLLHRKLAAAGLTDEQATVRFDRTYERARPRKVTIKGTDHKGSECPVMVEGSPETLHFAWLVGIGDLTGSGFGGLR